ncbi:MAG: co-chaperone GroES [Cellvibrionales bacterium]|jgi:chaperonin GroES|nr:co-chaperone GroES [Cellvibrionales bacterium]MBK8675473.1 co-chaperone GroES [Cellvibrionales bacterium]HRF88227.1 co-chaperone GroES [Pseudomonadales bacterium]HRG51058.1 co-chaperone GroES [Pseudomonadales bacterium]
MKIRPLHDRVVIRREEKEEKSAGGIVLASTAREKPNKGEVIAVGPGKALDDGQVRALQVKVGDKVVFASYAGSQTLKDGDDEFIIMSESEILGVLE